MTVEPEGTPGLPGYQAAPPLGENTPLPPPPPPGRVARAFESPVASIIPLVFGLIGFLFFNVFGIVAIFIGIAAFRSTGPIGKVMAGIGILLGAAGLVLSIIGFIHNHDLVDFIF